jgi:hypothetical protein
MAIVEGSTIGGAPQYGEFPFAFAQDAAQFFRGSPPCIQGRFAALK